MDATRLTLLERAGQGSAEAWTELDRLYRPFMLGWFGRQGAADAADDLTQDVMTALIQEVPQFVHNRRVGAFRTWLRNACFYRLLNHRRRQAGKAVAVGGTACLDQIHELRDPAESSAQEWDQEHDRSVLRHLFDRLSGEFDPKSLEAFRRLSIDGQPPAQVASELAMSVGAVYVAKSRVFRRLREEAAGMLAMDDELVSS